jgi:predicted O-linked N-acetylglucosamine transferase (SPINDLY family)
MDIRITDPHLDPPGASEAYYSERSVRPAPNYWCYSPNPVAPQVGDLPAKRNGFITLGCLNHFSKTNPTVLATWCRVLGAIPESRMLLHAHPGRHRDDVLEILRTNGVDPARLEFVGSQPTQQYLETYNRIDIALDPFPYHGGTTTCDALWMGVPVIVLAGKLAVHRAGASLLNNVGLPEFVANSPEEYERIAIGLANDLARLDDIRRTLRENMRRSPLCDANCFTRGLEKLLREAWRAR